MPTQPMLAANHFRSMKLGKGGRLTLIDGRAGDTEQAQVQLTLQSSQSGRWLYALSSRSQNVIGFSVQANGSLTSVGAFGGLPTTAAGIAVW